MSKENSRLVYSTEQSVSRKKKAGISSVETDISTAGQKVTVTLERKGRGGKSVTVIEGLRISMKKREGLLRQLKSGLGTGGAVKGCTLEIQGDRRNEVVTLLEKSGYFPKISGRQ